MCCWACSSAGKSSGPSPNNHFSSFMNSLCLVSATSFGYSSCKTRQSSRLEPFFIRESGIFLIAKRVILLERSGIHHTFFRRGGKEGTLEHTTCSDFCLDLVWDGWVGFGKIAKPHTHTSNENNKKEKRFNEKKRPVMPLGVGVGVDTISKTKSRTLRMPIRIRIPNC